MAGDENDSKWKLKGEERFGEREDAMRREILEAKTYAELKAVLARHQDIIHRDTDYKIQNITYMMRELELKRISVAEMPTQYGIKSKLTQLLQHDHKLHK